jgi:prepilin-type N-terminal cleavage/methylation domain-containing protein
MIRKQLHLGFSLIELLIAIFILGIGIISIAALFPAGMSQQQKSTDDLMGTIVARNALTLIRSKLEQEDFGYSKEFDDRFSSSVCGTASSSNTSDINEWPTVCGDWMWRRPAIFPDDYGTTSLRGAIDIFATPESPDQPLVEPWSNASVPNFVPPGIPFNKERYPDIDNNFDGVPDEMDTPVIRLLAGERQYPMWSGAIPNDRPKGQYYWDCMFRRYQGRILVAIFVYRVVAPSETSAYTIATGTAPELPYRANLVNSSSEAWNANLFPPTLVGTENDDPKVLDNQWQYPGQWLVDQNGNVHNVMKGRRRPGDSAVQLASSPAMLEASNWYSSPAYGRGNVNWWDAGVAPNGGFVDTGVVTDIWFVPVRDANKRLLVPVYATVQDL